MSDLYDHVYILRSLASSAQVHFNHAASSCAMYLLRMVGATLVFEEVAALTVL